MLNWIKEKLCQPEEEKVYPKATHEDVGRWVRVRDTEDEAWAGPYVFSRLQSNDSPYASSWPYKAGGTGWRNAQVIPGPMIRGTLHDCVSKTRPENIHPTDLVLIELEYHVQFLDPEQGEAWAPYIVMRANETPWKHVTRYQLLDLK